MCGLLSGQPPLQNPTHGVPIAEGGNVIRRLTGAMVHPSKQHLHKCFETFLQLLHSAEGIPTLM